MTFKGYFELLAGYKAGAFEGDEKEFIAEKLKAYERSQIDAGRKLPAGGLCF